MAKGETKRPFIAFVARRSSKSDAMSTMARKASTSLGWLYQ
ncbi:hypothetical protein MTR67_040882 [Solanum verrucosum]|uniref:Uncharacterized protein n=1 Tax=Solanum verrucosum TaxID=315347 RepID=A0AAF0UJR6_SOLVR|nr:hypothetical protein MTR67_040882 [Solanum verrucosum]